MQDYQIGFRAEEQTIRIEPAFEIVSGTLVACDPMNEVPSGVIEDVANGQWSVQVNKKNGLIKSVFIFNDELNKNNSLVDKIREGLTDPMIRSTLFSFVSDVDSGQFIFCDKASYRRFSTVPFDEKDYGSKSWYKKVSKETSTNERFGLLDYGIICSSGYGDGEYFVRGIKDDLSGKYIAFAVVFFN